MSSNNAKTDTDKPTPTKVYKYGRIRRSLTNRLAHKIAGNGSQFKVFRDIKDDNLVVTDLKLRPLATIQTDYQVSKWSPEKNFEMAVTWLETKNIMSHYDIKECRDWIRQQHVHTAI